MVVKCIALLAYVCPWTAIGVGVFHGMPVGLWLLSSALVFLGSIASWNALPQPASQSGLGCCGNCGSHGVTLLRDCKGPFPRVKDEKTETP